jgi:predicted transcriptional regulator
VVQLLKDDSFSVDVITRILSILSDEGDMKRTVLAGRARLNYSALIRYLRLLKTLRWIDSKDSDSSIIAITNVGRSFNKLLEQTGGGPSDISEEALERLLAFSREQNLAEGNLGKHLPKNAVTKAKTMTGSRSCSFCGNTLGSHEVTREIDGERYSFDRRECAILFMRFRDAYGKEFTL